MPDNDDEEVPLLEGPDPRTWPANDLWGLVKDLEVLDHVTELMEGPVAQEEGVGEAYHEARRFLRASGGEVREQLALMLLSMYGVKVGAAGTSPFDRAGKPRAFGAETSPPPGTLPSECSPPEGVGGRDCVYDHGLGIRADLRCRRLRRRVHPGRGDHLLVRPQAAPAVCQRRRGQPARGLGRGRRRDDGRPPAPRIRHPRDTHPAPAPGPHRPDPGSGPGARQEARQGTPPVVWPDARMEC